AIVFVPRCELIKDYVTNTGIPTNQFATYVSKEYEDIQKLGLQGREARNEAQILFTTHARLEQSLSTGRKFSNLSEFYYKGTPRKVLVRDEAAQPAISLTLGRWQLRDMVTPLEKAGFREAATTIEDFASALRSMKAGYQVIVPDLHHYKIPDDTFSIEQARAWL